MCHVIQDREFIPFVRSKENPGRLIGAKGFLLKRRQTIIPLYQTAKSYRTFPTTEGLWIGAPAELQPVRFDLPVAGEKLPIQFHRLIRTGIHVSPVEEDHVDQLGYVARGAETQTWLTPVLFNSGEILFYDGYDVSVAKVLVPWARVPYSLHPEEVWEMRCEERKVLSLGEGKSRDEVLDLLFQTDWEKVLVQAYLQSTYSAETVYEVRVYRTVKRIPFNQIKEAL